MQSLTLDGLKMNKKDLGFLPQIVSFQRDIKKKELKTIGTSRISQKNEKGN